MCGVINKLLAEYSTDKMCICVPVKKYLQIYKEKVKNASNELQWNVFIDKIKNAGCIKDYNRSSHNLSFAFTVSQQEICLRIMDWHSRCGK